MNFDINQYVHDLITLYRSGKHSEVVALSKKIEHEVKDNVLAQDLIALSNLKLGLLDSAITHYSRSIVLAPNNPESYFNLGVTNRTLGKLNEAIDSFNKAIQLDAGHVDAYFSIGEIYQTKKFFEKAIKQYETVLNLVPNHAEALNNLGSVFLEYGNPKKAIHYLSTLISEHPNYNDAFYNLGLAYNVNGDESKAIEFFCRAANSKPDDISLWRALSSALSPDGVSNLQYTDFYETIFLNLLNKRGSHDPHLVAPAILQFLLKNPIFAKHIANSTEIQNNNYLCLQVIKDFGSLPLLLKLMELCPIADLRIEKLFTECRKAILLNLHQHTDDPHTSVFLRALAMQCYTNEYVYSNTNRERNKVKDYIKAVGYELQKGITVHHNSLAIIACYQPLSDISWSRSLRQTTENKELLNRQVGNVAREKLLSRDIPVVGDVINTISSKVRQQYEDNPYPRWINTSLFSRSSKVYDSLHKIGLCLTEDVKAIKYPEILIAGCGTGRHALVTASRFENSKVTAIDLSLHSLSYAKRMTQEFGITNISYCQGDILNLGDLGSQYDLVESTGVLHHMQSPRDGLKSLIKLLKPGGLMRLGLYSERARQEVVKVRKFIAHKNISGTIEEKIRTLRQLIIDNNSIEKEKIFPIVNWIDFYSMSECRDLLFHVKEHRFSLPQINNLLREMNLNFIGFEFHDNSTLDTFRQKFGDPYSVLDLDLWDQYEKDNPSTFSSMYQFWIRKPL